MLIACHDDESEIRSIVYSIVKIISRYLEGPHMSKEKSQDVVQPKRNLPSNNDDQVRLFLARSTVGLMYLTLLAYIITRDIVVLGTTTIVGVAVIAVFRFFFTIR